MTETTVGADLLQALEVVTQLRVDAVGEDLAVLAVDDVALPVEEPGGDLVLGGVLDDGDDALEFLRGELSGTVMRVILSALIFQFPSSPYTVINLSSCYGRLVMIRGERLSRTACSGRCRPSCRPSWSIVDRHP